MIFLAAFAFLAGIVTILSPCILPILPIVLSGAVGGSGKSRPLGIVTGFIISFTLFTLFLSTLVKLTGVSADALRNVSVVVVLAFGLSLLIPKFTVLMERLFSRLSNLVPQTQNTPGFFGGFLLGLSLGLIWTPCVGPILASVITLAASSDVNLATFFITLSYSLGTAIPMLIIIFTGRKLFEKVPWLLSNSGNIQKVFGVLMILTALAIFFQFDRQFQAYILEKFPNYGTGLTRFEDNEVVKENLEKLQTDNPDEKLQMFGDTSQFSPDAPELIPGGKWFNSDPLQIKNLKGKVVLVDFWTYSCINCIRTFPYLRDWHEKYKDRGFVIIGVHSPEFEFEKSPSNLKKAIDDFKLEYPIVQDNDFETWRAYKNRYWPAKYLVDKEGKIRYTHFGEGKYEETEQTIQKLLSENGSPVSEELTSQNYQIYSKTPETYLGFERMERFASPEEVKLNAIQVYTSPKNIPQNNFAFTGSWIVNGERSNPKKGATLLINFDAKEVFLVMRPKNDSTGKVKVYLDNKLVSSEILTIDSDRLYKLINLEKPGRHTLKLEFLDSNTEVYAFTFG